MASLPPTRKAYAERAKDHPNPTARRLLELMDRKKTNLCVSVDVTTCAEALEVVRRVAPAVCMVKTHIDIIEDFTPAFTAELARLSDEHDFLIFEDRKFADIGNTVTLQYSSGVHRIAEWSHITNAHPLPGPGIITGLGTVGKPLGRALLLLAEMSSAGNLATGDYTKQAVEMARHAGPEWVIGFIAQSRVDGDTPEWDQVIITPGIALASKGDALGQQYRTPDAAIRSGSDVVIVGRGLYSCAPSAMLGEAIKYRDVAYGAYLERIRS